MTIDRSGNGKGRLLIVDDAPANLHVLRTLLTEQGYIVHPTTESELALRFVQSTPPDLILLDISLPGIDGYEVCERLKADERTREIPVIFIGTADQALDKARVFAVGGVDYIVKPFQFEEVLARVETHLALRTLQREVEARVEARTAELVAANARLQAEIAERRRAEEAYRLLVEHSLQGLFILQGEHIVFANQALVKILGYSLAELLAFTPDHLSRIVHADDRLSITERVAGGLTRQPERFEVRVFRKDGQMCWLEIVAIRAEYQGRPAIHMAVVDITEPRRAADHELRRRAWLERVLELGKAVAQVTDWEACLLNVYESVRYGLEFDRVEFFLYDLEHNAVRGVYGTGRDGERQRTDWFYEPVRENTIFREGLTSSNWYVYTPDYSARYPDTPPEHDVHGVKEHAAVAAWAGQRPVAVLAVDNLITGRPMTDEQLEALRLFAGYAGLAIENARLYAVVQKELTERRRAEDALRLSEERYRRAISAAGAVPYYLDYATNNYTFIGEGILAMLGYTPAEMKAELWDEIRQEIYLLGPLAGLSLPEAIERVRSGVNLEWKSDMLVRTRSGESRWLHDASIQVLDEHGRPLGAIGILHDVTERKRAEEALAAERNLLRTLIDNLPDNIYVKDSDGRFILSNRAVARFMGVATPEALLGKSDFDVYPAELAARYYADDQSVVQSGQPLINREEPALDQSTGETRWYLTIKVPFRDRQGQVKGLVGISRNITERKRAEEALRRYAQRLEGLQAIDRALLAAQSLPEVAEAALSRLRRLTPAQRADVILFDFTTGVGRILATQAEGEHAVLGADAFPIADFTLETFLGSDAINLVDDIAALPARSFLQAGLLECGLHSYVALPLFVAADLRGVLMLSAAAPAAFESEHRSIAQEVAAQLALGIQQAELRAELQRHAAELEQRVAQRTAELVQANAALQAEIAERQQLQAVLAAERNLLRTLIDTIPDEIYIKDAQLRFLNANITVAHLNGVGSPEALIGKRDFDLQPYEVAVADFLAEQAVIQTGQPMINRETVNASGTRWRLETKIPLRDSQDRIIGLVGVNRFITERKLAEMELARQTAELSALYRAATSLLTAGSALGDLALEIAQVVTREFALADCGVLLVNQAGTELERLARAGSYSVTTAVRLPLDGPGLTVAAVRSGESIYAPDVTADPRYLAGIAETRSELVVPLRVGQRVIGALDLQSPTPDAFDERARRIVSAFAERAALALENSRLFTELQRRAAELEAANRELESFSYSISHDLRAPLRHADGFARMLLKRSGDQLDAVSQRYIHTIIESAQRMSHLIDALLAFSRMSRMEVQHQPVSLSPLVLNAQRDLAPLIGGRVIAWDIGPLPTVEGDPTLLKQVFINLLSNAIKYTRPRAEAQIAVGTLPGKAATFGQPGEVIIFIRDNGVGFNMNYAHKLFGVFQRLHRDEDFEGTGIGLAIVQRIIQRHGGRVWAEGVVDEGATFYLSLPSAEVVWEG